MNNKDYRQHEGISKSDLFKITKSPLHFHWHMEHPEENDSPSLKFGRAVHKYILEKDDFFNEVAVMPVFDRRTKEGKAKAEEFMANAVGKDVISETDFEVIKEMAAVIDGSKYARRLLTGDTEQSFFWTDEATGETCKCRPDCLCTVGGQKIIVDYKTTEDAETEAFMRSAIKYGYDLQAGMYTEGMKANTGDDYLFIFVAQEKKPPYAINIVQADEFFMSEGNQLFHDLLAIYHECKETDNWYGYMKTGEVNSLSIPNWLKGAINTEKGEENYAD